MIAFCWGLGLTWWKSLCVILNDTLKFSMRVRSCCFLPVVYFLNIQWRDNQREEIKKKRD